MPNGNNNLPADLTPSLLGRWKVRILLLVLVVAIVGTGVAVATRSRAPKGAANETNSSTNNSVRTGAQPTINPQADADGDRLSDADERTLGTNLNSSDTDSDGLFDYEEVRTWKTDPKNPDTDGDGIPDGIEVRRGSNPNGPGSFLNVNAAMENVNR